jgi:hypothetical protein
MKSTRDKRKGFAPIPNALIDNPYLNLRDKMVLIKLASHAYGDKKTANPSQVGISKCLKIKRSTASAALDSLTALEIIRPHGKGRCGKKETFTIDLDRAANLSKRGPGNLPKRGPLPARLRTIKQTAGTKQSNKTLASNAAPATEVTAGEGVDGLGSAGSAASPVTAATSNGEVDLGHNGRSTLLQSHDIADEILDEVFGEPTPRRQYTKREINDLLLTPEGLRVDSDAYELEYDLSNVYLPMVCGEPLNRGEFDKLVAEQGVEFCRLWMHWLSRKIADCYRQGKPVKKPTALYIKAVLGRWQVDPAWPQFDEELHTVAAWAEAHKRQEARGPKAPVPGTSYAQNDVNRFADEVRSGERKLIYLPMQLQGPVRTRLDELYDAEAEAEEIPF